MKHIKLFEQFVQDNYGKTNENFTFHDAVDTAGEDPKDEDKKIMSALKALKARSGSEISIFAETPDGDDDLYDEIEKMKKLPISSNIYSDAYFGKYKGKNVVVFNDGEDLFAYIKESYKINEGKVSPDKVAKALYGTNANNVPAMTTFLNVKPGDMVTTVSPPLNQGSELLSFVAAMPKGTAYMTQHSVFGSSTLYAAFKNMSQDDFDELKAQFPKADVVDLDMYDSMKTKAKATASMKKLSNVESVSDASAKY